MDNDIFKVAIRIYSQGNHTAEELSRYFKIVYGVEKYVWMGEDI